VHGAENRCRHVVDRGCRVSVLARNHVYAHHKYCCTQRVNQCLLLWSLKKITEYTCLTVCVLESDLKNSMLISVLLENFSHQVYGLDYIILF